MTTHPDFNIKRMQPIFYDVMKEHPHLGKGRYEMNNNTFSFHITSGHHRCSFCARFIQHIDEEVSQEVVLVRNPCPEWSPQLQDKVDEEDFEKMMDKIRLKRLEYFATTTEKYREEVMARDGHKCLSCRTNGTKPYPKRKGGFMKNPLQIHHRFYNKDSSDSLMTLCNVCHYKLHWRLFKETGQWSSKEEDMKIFEK